MEKKSKHKACCEATPISCHGLYLDFLHALLAYLRDTEVDQQQQRRDLAKIETLAAKLKAELPQPHVKEGINVESQIDEILRLAREYYPSEGDSPELSEAIDRLNHTMKTHYGIT